VLGLGHLRLEHGAPAAAHLLQQARVPPRAAQLVGARLQDVDGGHQHSAHLLRQLRNKFGELANEERPSYRSSLQLSKENIKHFTT
jgi:hypothetical protein